MKTIITIMAAVGLASAGIIPVPGALLVGHVATQYHAQDELGQYSYGYAGGPSAKEEIKTADGITRGGYSYVDGNGLVQSAAYVSDPVNGFRVAATNLPAGPAVPATPEVVAPVAVAPAVDVVPLLPSALAAAVRVSSLPVATPVASSAPLSSTDIQSTVSPIIIQQESQSAVSEAVSEEKPIVAEPSTDSTSVEGSPSNPHAQSAPEPQAVATTIEQLVTPVQDTPEVQAAKAAHLSAFEEVKLRDAAQEAEDANNNITTGDSENENSQDGESTESTTVTNEALAPADAAPVAEPALPAMPSLQEPAAPASAAPASVVATQIVPAASPVAAPLIPSVLTREVMAAPVATGSYLSPFAAAPTILATPAVVGSAAELAPIAVGAPVVGTPSGPVSLEHVGQITSQYHSQDELGQYTFGYSGGPSAKHEVKTADGLTSGGYSYIDSHGLVQSAAYVSDPVNGFRVAATNIPKQRAPEYIPDSPEIEEAKQKLFQAQADHIAML